MARRTIPLADRFWNKVEKRGPDECWPWTGATKHGAGYGLVCESITHRMLRANRVSWELNVGPIPDGLVVCHRCDNPPCVNPAHLFVATQADNWLDMRRKGRDTKPPRKEGINHPQAKLTEAQVLSIRSDKRPKRVISAEYGVSRSLVTFIRRGQIWKHLSSQ